MNKHRYSSFFNNRSGMFMLMAWMTLMPWFSTVSLSYLALEHEELIRSFSLLQWLCFFTICIFSMGLAITPTTFISLVSGYFLGYHAIIPVVLSYQLASLVGYGLAQKLDNHTIDWVEERFPKSAPIFANVESRQWLTTFLARISPALPFGLMNVVLAVSGVRFGPFFLSGLLGMLPRTLFFIWLGAQAPMLVEAVQSNDYFGLFIVLSVAGIFGLFYILKPKP
ncbi:MAG: VTT domain-containing protein [Reichenbachiella sp.]|uniref:TVP38/TMEM64 family protein n=1 Tax=Reichenbachiella sp. TaxID=2184521 RepID=UPI0029661391|nr:VTT domain-containing protein [Reichenbachiella sp.]MDW3208618.1 VTT domain-containing protein [Reichenbachiella sp.]